MGHNMKTTNRGEAIARNSVRIKELKVEATEKFTELDEAMKQATRKMIAFGERLDELEEFEEQEKRLVVNLDERLLTIEVKLLPWWRKMRAYWRSNLHWVARLWASRPAAETVEEEKDEGCTAEEMSMPRKGRVLRGR